jgi:hypothetical protein
VEATAENGSQKNTYPYLKADPASLHRDRTLRADEAHDGNHHVAAFHLDVDGESARRCNPDAERAKRAEPPTPQAGGIDVRLRGVAPEPSGSTAQPCAETQPDAPPRLQE